MNASTKVRFRTTVGERQRCLLLSTFNIFLEMIMPDALEEHDEKVSISDRTISTLPMTLMLFLKKSWN